MDGGISYQATYYERQLPNSGKSDGLLFPFSDTMYLRFMSKIEIDANN
jgi:hypothetical protein